MASVSFCDVAVRHPVLVRRVIAQLSRTCEGLSVEKIEWHLVDCSDDPEAPLNVNSPADLMLTGKLRGLSGVSGSIGHHFACICDKRCDAG